MKILIVGLGYAGHRYLQSFEYLAKEIKLKLALAYVGRHKKSDKLEFFSDITAALAIFKPDIVVISTNDASHASILEKLREYRGFVICEKPLAIQDQNWRKIQNEMKNIRGFALDLVERYSEATQHLKQVIAMNGWSLARAHFYWGKDRLNDYRPTCGVTSEVVHALDLVSWICSSSEPVMIENALGVRSDFSISGEDVLDSVLLTGRLGNIPFTGYSSFVNIQRQRNVDFSFINNDGDIIHSRITYDTPEWDHDHLRIWTRDPTGAESVITDRVYNKSQQGLETIYKLSNFCMEVIQFVASNIPPAQPFAGLDTACGLQELLDNIEHQVVTTLRAKYIRAGERKLLSRKADLESLG
ncbi:Gfo/Idh/MocA family oxidoreductase [Brenneria goodwinii]|uniref:Gfo/Idh/MocA family oxidoreductase n=1 Tax=Brenneria goodwinii TaxID=1109412 RepID=UPI0036E309C5